MREKLKRGKHNYIPQRATRQKRKLLTGGSKLLGNAAKIRAPAG
tara:strand:+ start:55 stop:186 length:132 start_codon:yes stop_codon:yes gene_type:complete